MISINDTGIAVKTKEGNVGGESKVFADIFKRRKALASSGTTRPLSGLIKSRNISTNCTLGQLMNSTTGSNDVSINY